ncbi:ribonuclease H-like domain-containing protein [Tanacetum coccineum]
MSVHNSVHNTPHNYVHNTPHNSDDEDVNDHAVTLISKLDLSHHLHLHPNDSAALTVVSVKLKGTKNDQVWSCAMLLALEGKNKTGFIDGSCIRSNTDEVLRRQWDRVNAIVLGSILSGETLSDVRSAYAIISNKEFHRIASGNITETSQISQTSASLLIPNDNGNRRTAGGSNVVYENCGFNTHTTDRCFKIIGYPPDFGKKKAGQNFKGKNVFNNAVSSSSSFGFSDEQLSTLISLIIENYVNGKGMHANMAGFESMESSGNCQRAKQTREAFPLSDQVSTEIGEIERSDPNPNRYGTPSPHSGSTFKPLNESGGGHSQGSNVVASEEKRSANHEDNQYIISEGNGLLFSSQNDQDIFETQNLRRSSRPSVFPRNYNNFVVVSKVKYGLEKYVNYSHLSKDNYCFTSVLNKSFKTKSFEEAAKHQPWVNAMNSEMDALYRNNT